MLMYREQVYIKVSTIKLFSVEMNFEQQQALDKIKAGHNVFLTGPGGVGKSFTMKAIVQWAKFKGLNYGVTATTGSAAVLVGGRTIHSFLGIGLGTKTAEQLATKVTTSIKVIGNRIKKLQLLVIDEISMMDKELLDKISLFLQIVRNSYDAPFGGIQMVFVGDFCQLQPPKGEYCFLAESWKNSKLQVIALKTMMRQKDDPRFQLILNKLRSGECNDEMELMLKNTQNNKFQGNVQPTMLYCNNVAVDSINEQNLDKLLSKGIETKEYPIVYSDKTAQTWAESLKIQQSMKLCVGCQVVCTWNIDQDAGIINGTRGVVRHLDSMSIDIELVDGRIVSIEYIKMTHPDMDKVFIQYLPVKLAWALTIHKSQGMTLDCVAVDLKGVFACGQGYTALSRVRNMSNLQVYNVSKKSFMVHPKVLEFYKTV